MAMLTVRDIAEDLQLTTQTVSQKLKDKTIPGGTKVLGAWRVDADKYAEWKDQITGATPRDPYLLAPLSPRAKAARKAAATRNRPTK